MLLYRMTATENPYEPYRVGGIAQEQSSTYAARMECSHNVPTCRAGVGRAKGWLLLLALSTWGEQGKAMDIRGSSKEGGV
jgi:hypothetical protein